MLVFSIPTVLDLTNPAAPDCTLLFTLSPAPTGPTDSLSHLFRPLTPSLLRPVPTRPGCAFSPQSRLLDAPRDHTTQHRLPDACLCCYSSALTALCRALLVFTYPTLLSSTLLASAVPTTRALASPDRPDCSGQYFSCPTSRCWSLDIPSLPTTHVAPCQIPSPSSPTTRHESISPSEHIRLFVCIFLSLHSRLSVCPALHAHSTTRVMINTAHLPTRLIVCRTAQCAPDYAMLFDS